MVDGETTDVQPAETTTATESSSVDQTSPGTDETTSTEVDSKETEELKNQSVPYDRFKEVNEEAKTYREKAAAYEARLQALEKTTPAQDNVDPTVKAAREQLKGLLNELAPELGFVRKEELERDKQDQQLQSVLTNLEQKYSGKEDPALKFERSKVIEFAIKNGIGNPEYAYKLMTEKARTNYAIKQALAKGKGFSTETSNGTGSSNSAGPSDADLRQAAARGDKGAVHLMMKRIAADHLRKKG